jgi:flagellar motor switch/type III secretory pathway protein FliN
MAVAAAQAQRTIPMSAEKPRPEPENHVQANENTNEDARWRPVLGLPCLLTVDLPIPNFKLADFLKLQAGSLIPTMWRIRRDVPLRVNGTLIGWCEFEGAGNCLAVRLTELA